MWGRGFDPLDNEWSIVIQGIWWSFGVLLSFEVFVLENFLIVFFLFLAVLIEIWFCCFRNKVLWSERDG